MGKFKFLLLFLVLFILMGCTCRYKITLVTNNGENVAPIEKIKKGSKVDLPEICRTGYLFDGWYLDNAFTHPFSEDCAVNGNLTLYAKWKLDSFTLTFDANGGTPVQSITRDFGVTINLLESTKAGYTFGGWYTNQALTDKFTSEEMPARDTTLYARWIPNQYTLTFETNGGTPIEEVTGDCGSSLDNFTTSKVGYTFLGWYVDGALEHEFTSTTMPTENTTLYAQWGVNQYTITFEPDGGTAVAPVTQDFASALPVLPTPEKEGYAFKGWFIDAECLSPFTSATMPAEDITLHAGWEINQYTLTFELDGGTMGDHLTLDYGSVIGDITPIKEGHTFKGWYEDENLAVAFTSTTMPAKDLMLYAQWEISSYCLTYETNGSTDLEPVVLPFNVPLEFPTLAKSGYTFAGWYEDEQLTQLFDLENMPARDVVLYAKWIFNPNLWEISFEESRYVINRFLGSPTDLEIPEKINGIVVSRISERAFYNMESLKKIVIPDCITSIGIEAFSGCTNMEDIHLSSKLSVVPERAFAGCVSLETIVLPTSITSIEAHAFDGCQELRVLTLSSNLARIGQYAFSSCLRLDNLVVPGSIEFIGDFAFKDCITLANIVFPDVFVQLGADVFSNTSWINNHSDGIVYLGKMVYQYKGLMPVNHSEMIKTGTLGIGHGAFKNCNNLLAITLPASVLIIDDYAFEDCGSLVNITFEGVISIGSGAFKGCVNMINIIIPSTVKAIGLEPFEGCTRLCNLYTPSDNVDKLMQLLNNDSRIRSL